jgi:hypothetical protein
LALLWIAKLPCSPNGYAGLNWMWLPVMLTGAS